MSSVKNVLKIATNPEHFIHPISPKKGVNDLKLWKRILGVAGFFGLTICTGGTFGVYSLISAGEKHRKIKKLAKEEASKPDNARKSIQPEKIPEGSGVDGVKKPTNLTKLEAEDSPEMILCYEKARSAMYENNVDLIKELMARDDFSMGTGFEHLLSLAINKNPPLEVIKELLTKFNINECLPAPRGYETTPLIKAVGTGNKKLVEFFLDAGAELYNPNHPFEPALNVACKNGNMEIVHLLIERGDQVKGRDKFPTPISVAVENKHFEVVEYLKKQGEEFPVDVEALVKESSWKALTFVVLNEKVNVDKVFTALIKGDETKNSLDYLDLLKALTDRGLDMRCHSALEGMEPKKWAEENQRQFLAFFLQHKGNLSDVNIFKVINKGWLKVFRVLIKNGANPNVSKNGNNLLHEACRKGHVDCVKDLLNLVSSDVANDKDKTPFQIAFMTALNAKDDKLRNNLILIMQILIDKNPRFKFMINQPFKTIKSVDEGPSKTLKAHKRYKLQTCFQIAIEKRKVELVNFFIRNGAQTDLYHEGTEPPIIIAVKNFVNFPGNESEKILEKLIAEEVNINTADGQGNTSLHFLALMWKDSTEEVQLRIRQAVAILVDKSGSLSSKNAQGKNPRDLFLENGGLEADKIFVR